MVSRSKLAALDRRWAVKFALRIVTLLLSTVVLGCHAWIITGTTQFAYWYAGWLLGLVLVASSSVLWCLANITSFIYGKPFHPGVNVGFDLVLWIMLTITSIICSLNVWYFFGAYGSGGSYYYYGGSSSSSSSSSLARQRQRKRTLNAFTVRAVGVIFAYVAVILHFTLFVLACIDCDRRNKSKNDWQAAKIAQQVVTGMDQRRNAYQNQTIAHGQPIYAPIPQIYRDHSHHPQQQFHPQDQQPYQQSYQPHYQPQYQPQYQQQYQGPQMPNSGTGYMAVPQQAAFHPPPPGSVGGIEAARGGNVI